MDTLRNCAFCFPAPVAVLQIKSSNVLLNKRRNPNEIVPAVTRKSIENIQQLLSLSSFTLIGLFCPSPYALSEKATALGWSAAERRTISHPSPPTPFEAFGQNW